MIEHQTVQLHGDTGTLSHDSRPTPEKTLKVLILEDVPSDAELVQQELSRAGLSYVSRRVDTEDGFLREMSTFAPDIILADYSLPQFGALEALRVLKESRVDIPFILVTGTQSEEVAVECMKQGADDYILKTSLKRLPTAVLKTLEKKEIERDKEKAEEALRRSEEQYRLIAENTHDVICLLDPKGNVLYVSQSCTFVLGYSQRELIGGNFYSLVHPADRDKIVKSTEEAVKKKSVSVDFRYNLKIGGWRYLEAAGNWILDKQGIPQRVIMILRDVSERKEAEEQFREYSQQLRALSARLQNIREEERTRIAREIHDELGQVLTALKMDIALLERKVSNGGKPDTLEQVKVELAVISRMIDTTIQSVRKIATELRPDVLDNLGLAEAIQWQAQEFEHRTGIRCTVRISARDFHLEQESSTAVFRIFQEALTNVVRHAEATHVEVSLEQRNGTIILFVKDNGKGISESDIFGTKSLGLLGMRERSHLLGGEVSISGKKGEGTSVTVRVPARRTSEEGKVG